MKSQGYLGNWTTNGDNAFLSNCSNPFNLLLTLTPPKWLDQELKLIQANRELPTLERSEEPSITVQEFNSIFKKSELTLRQFSNNIGLTHTMVGFLLKGKRPITKDVSEKIIKFRNKLLESQAQK